MTAQVTNVLAAAMLSEKIARFDHLVGIVGESNTIVVAYSDTTLQQQQARDWNVGASAVVRFNEDNSTEVN
jgi:hypothetical protein